MARGFGQAGGKKLTAMWPGCWNQSCRFYTSVPIDYAGPVKANYFPMRSMRPPLPLALLLALALLLPACLGRGLAASTAPSPGWEPVGISGGGGMFAPAISPADPNLMMLNCDMSAAYLSEDGGRNWRMIDHAQLRSDTACRPAFHPYRSEHHLRLLRRTAQDQP